MPVWEWREKPPAHHATAMPRVRLMWLGEGGLGEGPREAGVVPWGAGETQLLEGSACGQRFYSLCHTQASLPGVGPYCSLSGLLRVGDSGRG